MQNNLKLLFKLDPEAAFNLDPEWVWQHYSFWVIIHKYQWVVQVKEIDPLNDLKGPPILIPPPHKK